MNPFAKQIQSKSWICFGKSPRSQKFYRLTSYTMVRPGTAVLLLGAALAIPSAALTPKFSTEIVHKVAKRAPSPDVLTDNVVALTRVVSSTSSFGPLHKRAANGTATFTNPFQYLYRAEITFGNETFSVIVDTGSSDTWVAQEGYQCLDANAAPVDVRSMQHCFPCLWFADFCLPIQGVS